MKQKELTHFAEKWKSKLDYIRKEYFQEKQIKDYRNEEGVLHRADGPAVITPQRIIHYIDGRKHGPLIDIDGTTYYFYENIHVPDYFFQKPEELTIEKAFSFKNSEVKYAALKIIGYEKLLESDKVLIIDQRPDLQQILFEIQNVFVDPFRIVQVQDGTLDKKYYLTVPPTVKTCKEAVAWTFYMEPEEYNPEIET